jgi:hypothetical protein
VSIHDHQLSTKRPVILYSILEKAIKTNHKVLVSHGNFTPNTNLGVYDNPRQFSSGKNGQQLSAFESVQGAFTTE